MSKVNRSIYQKVVEENKALIADIKLMVSDLSVEQLLCKAKWLVKFKEEAEFNSMLKQAAKRYISEHASELPDFITKPQEEKNDN